MKPASESECRVEIQMSRPGTFPVNTSDLLKMAHSTPAKTTETN